MNVDEFRPDWISAPGDTIADILAERSLSTDKFAQLLGETVEQVRDLLDGRATITIRIARQLERVLGGSVEFWISRDFQYRQDSARLHAADQEWLAGIPVGDMIRFGWLKPVPRPSEEVSACLRFFDVRSIYEWHRRYANVEAMVAFRTSKSFDSHPGAVAAWLRKGEIESSAVKCECWSPEKFKQALLKIRALTREKDPDGFLPQLRSLCADSGVAVAIVRAPFGCRASGATRFISREKALLLLSFRYLSDDHFWFTFFHEAGHLLLHGESRLFLEGLDTASTKEEEEANDFAARTLVPPEFQYGLLSLPLDSRQVIRFARRLGVSPGIVVGQLQYHKRIKYNQLNGLKRRFEWRE